MKMDQVLDKHLIPLDRLTLSQGVAQGYTTARNGKDSRTKSALRALTRKAHPQETIIIPAPEDPPNGRP